MLLFCKMAYSITARNLTISHGDDPRYWKFSCDPSSGLEVAKLLSVCWFDIRASVSAGSLRDGACYSAYLVFKLDSQPSGLEKATAAVRFLEEKAPGTDNEGYTVYVSKVNNGDPGRYPVTRCDGWMELKLGDFINNHGPGSTVETRIFETSDNIWKSGITIKEIELRAHMQTYTITARNLTISHGDDPRYWKFCDDPSSGSEVAKLLTVCWFDIRARVSAGCLRNDACYSAYLVFKLDSQPSGLEKATAAVRFLEEKAPGTDNEGYTVYISKVNNGDPGHYPVNRGDGWMELKLGDFINNLGPGSMVEMRIFETSDDIRKSGITIKEIELRPCN